MACFKLESVIMVFSIFMTILLLYCGQVSGAAMSLNRHSRYVPVSPTEFNCSGIPDGYFIHQSSCSIFYACVGGNAYKSECVPGLLYHPDYNTCESEHLVNCSKITMSTTKMGTTLETMTTRLMTTPKTTTRRTTTLPAIAQVDCSEHASGYLIRNPVDCSKYFECTDQATVPFICPGNLVFSEKIRGCDYRENVPECKI